MELCKVTALRPEVRSGVGRPAFLWVLEIVRIDMDVNEVVASRHNLLTAVQTLSHFVTFLVPTPLLAVLVRFS